MTIFNNMDLILFKEFFRDHGDLNEEEFQTITKFISLLTDAKTQGCKNAMYSMAYKGNTNEGYAEYFDLKQKLFDLALKMNKINIKI